MRETRSDTLPVMDALIAFRARAKCPPPERPRRIVRAAAAFAAAIFTLAAILISTGLATGTVVGAADNGDGSRLYCGAGLALTTPGGNSAWLGGVVLHFVPAARCPDPYPSLAQVLLDVVGTGSGADLRVLGALYALVFTAVAACAGWVATSRGVRRAVLLVPVIMPLWDSAFTRMLISTFSEPVGLLAAFTVACGIAAAVTRPVGWDRALMLGLLAVGAIGAAWAKPAYAPLALVAAAAAALSGGRRAWRASVATAAGIGVVSGALFIHLSSLQTRHYAAINSHNLVYTLALTEMPGSAPALGLPAAAQNAAGRAYYPAGPEGVPGADVVAAAPGAVRNRVLVELAEHPAAMVRALSVAVQATAAPGTLVPAVAGVVAGDVADTAGPDDGGAGRGCGTASDLARGAAGAVVAWHRADRRLRGRAGGVTAGPHPWAQGGAAGGRDGGCRSGTVRGSAGGRVLRDREARVAGRIHGGRDGMGTGGGRCRGRVDHVPTSTHIAGEAAGMKPRRCLAGMSHIRRHH